MRDEAVLIDDTDDADPDEAAITLDLTEWRRPVDLVDDLILRRCTAPTLDVGCGPGRMVLELNRRGVPALGIDLAPEAVHHVRAHGGYALIRSVFSRLPGEGRWPNVLLLDGCIGIGGSPELLLRRIRELLAPHGTAYVEHHPDPDLLVRTTARLRSRRFAWALVGGRHLAAAANAVGLSIVETWAVQGRFFAALSPRGLS